MKIKDKFKKKLETMGVAILSASNNAFQDLYGVPQAAYGVPMYPNKIWLATKILIMPITFTIGTIIYLKKSKSKMTKKVLVVVSILIALILLAMLVDYFI